MSKMFMDLSSVVSNQTKFSPPNLDFHDPGLDMLHERLGTKVWTYPIQDEYGKIIFTNKLGQGRIIISVELHDNVLWIHASMSRKKSVPSYDDLKLLYHAVFEDKWAYQVFAPPEHHINLHPYVLHLYGREDGKPALPNFILIDPVTGERGI